MATTKFINEFNATYKPSAPLTVDIITTRLRSQIIDVLVPLFGNRPSNFREDVKRTMRSELYKYKRIFDIDLMSDDHKKTSWADIVDIEENRISEFNKVIERIYDTFFSNDDYKKLRPSITDLTKQIIHRSMSEENPMSVKLQPGAVRSIAHIVEMRVTRMFPLEKLIILLLAASSNASMLNVVSETTVSLIRVVSQVKWIEVSMFRYFIIPCLRVLCPMQRQITVMAPEGLLDTISSASAIPAETSSLITSLRETSLGFADTNKMIQEGFKKLVDYLSALFEKISNKFTSFTSPTANYTMLGDGEELTFIQKLYDLFERIYGAIINFSFKESVYATVIYLFNMFSEVYNGVLNQMYKAPMPIKICLLAVATHFMYTASETEATTVSSIFWKLVVLYISGLVFVGVLDSCNIVKHVIKTICWFSSHPKLTFTFCTAFSFFLCEALGITMQEYLLSMVKFMSHVPKYSSGIVATITIVGTMWNKIIYKLVEDNPEFEGCVHYSASDKLYMETREYVEDLQNALAEGTVVHSETLARVTRSFEGLQNLLKNKYPRELSSYTSVIQHTLSKARTYISNAKKFGVDVTGPRQEPICILIRGEPGVLKSAFATRVNYVVQSLIKFGQDISYENLIKDTFSINVHSDYWEGYQNQTVVVMDDWMQMREQVGDATSSSKIIDMVNSMPTPLNMANVDAKGTVYFTSKAVILTSNIRKIASEAIESNEALARRIHLYLDIEIKPEYAKLNDGDMKTGKIDPAKLYISKKGESIIPEDVWNITLYKSCLPNGTPCEPVRITWDILISLIKKEYAFKRNVFRSMQANLDSFKSNLYCKISGTAFGALDSVYLKKTNQIDVREAVEKIHDLEDIVSCKYVSAITIVLQAYEKVSGHADFFEHLKSRGLDPEIIKACLLLSIREWVKLITEREVKRLPITGYIEAIHRFASALTDDVFLASINANDLYVNIEKGYLPIPSSMDLGLIYNVAQEIDSMTEHSLSVYREKNCPPFVIFVKKYGVDFVKYTAASAVVLAALMCAARWFLPQDYYDYFFEVYTRFTSGEFLIFNEDKVICEDGTELQMLPESSVKGKHKIVKPKAKRPIVRILQDSEVQGYMPLNYAGRMQMEIVNKVDRNSCVVMIASLSRGPLKNIGNALFIQDDIVMFNKHYLKIMETLCEREGAIFKEYDDLVIFLCSQCSIKDFEKDDDQEILASKILGGKGFNLKAFLESARIWGEVTGTHDIVLMPVGKGHAMKSISHLFVSEKDYALLDDIFPGVISSKLDRTHVITNLSCKKLSFHRIPNFNKEGIITFERAVEYGYSLGPGSCGSPLFLTTDKSSCLLGIHAAGSTDQAKDVNGNAIILSREQILTFLSAHNTQPEGDGMTFPFPFHKHIMPRPSSMNISSIVSTNIQGLLGPLVKKPAKLGPFRGDDGIIVNPLLKAYSGYGKGVYAPDPQSISEAKKDLLADLIYHLPKFSTSVLSTHDSIHSIELDGKRVPGIARGTSVGYPYNMTLCKSKKTLWGDEGDYTFVSQEWMELELIINKKEQGLRLGQRQEFYFQDCLKDETLPVAKVAIGKTRMFSACSVDYLVLFRKYFLGVISMLTESRFLFPSMVGINPLSHEWNKLAFYLAEPCSIDSPNFLDGDFAGFDKSQKKEIFIIIFEIIQELYDNSTLVKDEEYFIDQRVRKLLWLEVYQSLHVWDEYVINWDGALPSGHPMTTLINSFYNIFSFYYCWHRCCASVVGNTKSFFTRNVKLAVYGDDVILGVSDSAREIFNFDVIQKYMAELGLEFTPAEKTKITDEYKNITQCTFLKRGFRIEPLQAGVFVAPLSLDSLINSLYWRKKTMSEITHLRMVGETFIDELAFHDSDTYSEYSTMLIAILRKLNIIKHRIELDQTLRQNHVLFSYDNVYEFTDKYIERHLQLKEGARLYDVDDSFAVEGNSVLDSYIFTPSIKNISHKILAISEDLFLNASHILCTLDGEFPSCEGLTVECSRLKFLCEVYYLMWSELKFVLENYKYDPENLYYYLSVDYETISLVTRPFRSSSVSVRLKKTNLNKTMITINTIKEVDGIASTTRPKIEIAQILNEVYSEWNNTLSQEYVPNSQIQPEGSMVDETVTDVTSVTTDIPAASQQGPTASFVSSDSTKLTEYIGVDITPDFRSSQVTGVDQRLEEFFAKPVLHTTGTLATTDSATTLFPVIFLPFDAQAVAMWRDKFKGFMSMKFDLVVRFQVNSTRFQQGRYMLYYIPYCGDVINTATVGTPVAISETWNMMHSANTHCITQAPHVELDIATQSEVVLRIPYINADPFTPMTVTPTGKGSWGRVSIFPYAALQATAGSTDASYSLWYSLENVELYTPTLPQGDIEARERKGDGPITKGLTLATKASRIIGRIPILSAIAGPTSFFLDVASDVARVFGWSRPLDTMKAERRLLSSAPYFCNMDAPVYGMPLTNFVDTSVGNLPGFAGSALDEMAFANIVSRYSYYKRYTWATSDLSAVNLIHLPVYPSLYYVDKVMGAPALTYRQHTPVSFVASLFRFWRGSLKFRFKLVKTEFHSGRILVTYVPFDYRLGAPTTSVLNSDMQQYASKTTYDISSMTEFEIILPYASNAPWADTSFPIGNLDVFVLDPLKAPNTVTSSITILLEVAMCPDAQFNDYHSENVRTAYVPEIRVEGAAVTEDIVDTQCIGGSGTVIQSEVASQYCMGDDILSFRTLLKRPSYILMTDSVRTALPGTYSQTGGFQTFCAPYRASAAFSTVVAAVDTLAFPSTGANDLYSMLSCIYALSRGSMCCEIHNNVATTQVTGLIVRKLKNPIVGAGVTNPLQRAAGAVGNTGGASYEGTNGMRGGAAPLIAFSTPNNLSMQVKVDCYNRAYSRPNASLISCDNLNLTIPPDEWSQGSYAPAVVIAASTPQTNLYSWSRFASDDFSMGYFICIPPVLNYLSDIATDGSY